MACVPNETEYTVEEYLAFKKALLSGAREVQYADKRVVYRSLQELGAVLQMMYDSLYGHCGNQSALGRTIYVTSSKGIC